MKNATKEKLEEVAVQIIMVPLYPVVIALGIGAWFICECILDDDDRYSLFKKW